MAVQAAIFDMDGTIVDSMPYHVLAWQLFLSNKGKIVSDKDLKEKTHGTLFDIMPRFFGADISREESYRLAMEKEILFRNMYEPEMKPIDGLERWLQKLKKNNIKIGLGTAADFSNTNFTIDKLNLRQYFETIVTSDIVPVGKPNPEVFLYAAKKLGVAPEHCVVYEDTYSGVAAAKAAGMKVVAVTTMHKRADWESIGVDGIIGNYYEANLEDLTELFL